MLVSIIIPTYKRASMLSRAIESVLDQTYKNIEIIVVDDNDPLSEYRKSTEQIMNKYKDELRVKYIKHSKNMNGAVARNTGIKESRGEIIGFLDDDDWFYSDKIEKQIKFLYKNPICDGVYCGIKFPNKSVRANKEGDLSFELLSGSYLVYTISLLIKKEALIKSGGWIENLRRNQEAGMLLKYFGCGFKLGCIDEILCEVDQSDRSNALNACENDKEINNFLKLFETEINKMNKNKVDKVYLTRYRGILLSYLKEKKIKDAIKVYIRYLKKFPLKYNICLLSYIYVRTGI